jgi:hypothetical protein
MSIDALIRVANAWDGFELAEPDDIEICVSLGWIKEVPRGGEDDPQFRYTKAGRLALKEPLREVLREALSTKEST